MRDYDGAIAFYTGKLGFTLLEDSPRPEEPGKRWVLVALARHAPSQGGRSA